MGLIQLLPPHVVNKIAAGEVVERPASVVKELTENALDAGATRIDIQVRDGGRWLRIADNGCGMSADDARLAFSNHATSKLKYEADLFRIGTLGFRGEALASISAIARVTCQTRTADSLDGTQVTVDTHGQAIVSPSGCAPGTVMEIADLFYSTPARLKFLKKPQTEMAHVEEVVQYLALSHPGVAFVLTLDGKTVLDTPGQGELADVVSTVFGNQDLLAVRREETVESWFLNGLTSKPAIMKPSRRWLALFVNKRSVRCPVLSKAVESAYENLMPPKRYPVSVLFLTVPPEQVDVNVHPSKREVRYAQSGQIFSFVRASIREMLESRGHWQQADNLWPSADFTTVPVDSGPLVSASPFPLSDNPIQALLSSDWSASPAGGRVGHFARAEATTLLAVDQAPDQCRVVGQLYLTYMLVETIQGLLVVDQHIASERILFERFSQQLLDTNPDFVQPLLLPVRLSLRPEQVDLLARFKADFYRLGFEMDCLDNAVTIYSIPALYQERLPADLFEQLLARLEAGDSTQLPIHDLVATLACHSAVRAGDALTNDQMMRLMHEWLQCQLPWSCPHGRPIAHTIPRQALNHFFERPGLPKEALSQLVQF